MTTLRFYQGLSTIGGTIIELQTAKARCLFDFGLIFDPTIDARVRPRPDALVHDGLQTGSLAPIEGVYDAQALHGLPLLPYGQTQPRPFVLISHMHLDHMGALGLLAGALDVYMTRDSLRLYRGLHKTGETAPGYHRNCIGLQPMRWNTVEDIRFRLIPVDHDVPGACGFEFITPDGRICYTGDLRLHGRGGDKSLTFADTVQGADVCIIEGTTVSFIEDFDAVIASDSLQDCRSEALVESEILEAAQANTGMVFINLYRRNVERVHTLKTALERTGRQFVMQRETAVLYRQFHPAESVAVFEPSMGKRALANATSISIEDLQAHPKHYALDLPYEQLLSVLDFEADQSLYIHSDGVPLGAYDPGYQKLMDFLSRQGIAYRAIGCGGHAKPAHLKYILNRIAPKTLVPLHSLTPQKMNLSGVQRVLPEAGRFYTLSDGRLTLMP